jgi:inorganic pyrophosphatase
LKKILPLGMVFPYDFGMIKGTRGEDGDPIDAMVITETNTYPGARDLLSHEYRFSLGTYGVRQR